MIFCYYKCQIDIIVYYLDMQYWVKGNITLLARYTFIPLFIKVRLQHNRDGVFTEKRQSKKLCVFRWQKFRARGRIFRGEKKQKIIVNQRAKWNRTKNKIQEPAQNPWRYKNEGRMIHEGFFSFLSLFPVLAFHNLSVIHVFIFYDTFSSSIYNKRNL